MPADICRFADFELDRSAYQLRRKGRPVEIERIPLDLLFLLAEKPGQLVTRGEILERIWGKDVFLETDHSINIAVQKIRQVLHDDAETPRFVATVRTKGYRFIASLREIRREMPDVAPHRDSENGIRPQQSAIVGRTRELAELRGGLADATAGRGSLLLISGEPGIGKTRLSAELASLAQASAMAVRIGQCLDRDEAVSYLPFVEILESCVDRISDPRELRKLVGTEGPELARLLPRLGRLLPDLAPPLDLPPRETRRHLFNSFCDFIARLVSEQPTLFIIEDLHWADDSTLSLLDHLVKRLSKLPLLIVGTFREAEVDVSPALAKTLEDLLRGHLACRIRLKTLPLDEVAEMVTRLSGMSPPAKVVREIYDETDGNPFFVEELFLHLKEENRLYDSSGVFRSELKIGELDAPQSVRMVVGRRLARLSDPTRKCMATMAAVGRSFSFEVLQAASGTPPDSLLDSVAEAERAGLIYSSANSDLARFEFSHELIRQAVLGSLSAAKRERLHLQAAQAIEQVYGNALEDHVNELAYHYARSANNLKAVEYLKRAASQAIGTGSFKKAETSLHGALRTLGALPEDSNRDREELAIQIALASCASALKGYGSRERLEPSLMAHKLCLRLGDQVRLVPVLKNLGDVFYHNEQYDRCREIIKELTELGDQIDDPVARLLGTQLNGLVCWSIGDFSKARNCSEQVLHQSERLHGWLSLWTWTMSYRCLSLAALGYIDQARRFESEVLLAESYSSYRKAIALRASSVLNVMLGDGAKAEAAATQLKQIAEEYRTLARWGAECHGWAIAAQGSVDEGIAELSTVDEISVGRGFHCRALSDSYLSGKDASKALEWARRGLTKTDSSGERQMQAELWRLTGEALLLANPGDTPNAEQSFRLAIEVAAGQSAKLFELCAATSLARLFAKQNRRDEARTMLADTYNWFTEGFDTMPLRDAKALLDELSA